MRNLHDLVNPERPGRLHTFDILLHLLESVDIDQLDDLNFTVPAIRADPEQNAPGPLSWESCRSQWRNAWQFLRSEAYVVIGSDPKNPNRITLSDDGLELLEDLLECRINPESPLYIDEPVCNEPVSSDTSYQPWDPYFQIRVYRTIGVAPCGNGRPHLYFGTVDEGLGTDGGNATADTSRRA